ncbi:unnamed protein product [Spirodela intermedia]|uniref:GTD-binding domain-containing protein n=1 Tax=Spirodela intermedia TaxID=51605 RepID=A0A7I8IMU7_SPIIN|nr:unnamed protein product [Spirodela intermedia]CAA6658467.1 unnamed protein product [Spirodela intermedia]
MGSKAVVRGSGDEDDEDGRATCCSCDCRPRWQRSVKRKREAMEAEVAAARVEVADEVAALREALASHQQTVAELYTELEEERAAAATATDEAMSMILRLQQEKADAQMEARQFRRFVEEKMFHDQQELAALEDALFLREQALQTLSGEIQSLRRHSIDLPPLDPGGAETTAYDHPEVCEYPPLRCSEHRHWEDRGLEDDHDLDSFPEEHLQNLERRMEQLERTEMEKGVVELQSRYRRRRGQGLHRRRRPWGAAAAAAAAAGGGGGGGVIKKLYMRLEALEADRESMRQAIVSMRTDKAQLVLLKEIAQNLCQDAFSPPPPPPGRKLSMRPSTVECSSFMSMVKWIMSFAIWKQKAQRNERVFGVSSSGAGLSLLLEKPPHLRQLRCLSRTRS